MAQPKRKLEDITKLPRVKSTDPKMYRPNSPELIKQPAIQTILTRLKRKAITTQREYTLNTEAWREGLKKHPDQEYTEEILRRNSNSPDGGWSISSQNVEWECDAEYSITIEEACAGLEKLEQMLGQGYVIGPFLEEKDYPEGLTPANSTIAPLFFKLEYKPDGKGGVKKKHRLLSDFSCRHNGTALNDKIPDDEKTVHYITLHQLVEWIQSQDLQWLWAIDAQDAYYRMPIQKHLVKSLGVKLAGVTFHFTCLVMGIASACRLYTEFAEVVKWIIMNDSPELFLWKSMHKKGGQTEIVEMLKNYIDDFIGGAREKEVADQQYQKTIEWWNKLNIPPQIDKCSPPDQLVRYLGFILNAKDRVLTPTKERLAKYHEGLNTITNKAKGENV